MQHVAEALVTLGGACLICGLLAWVDVPIGPYAIPLLMLAGIVLRPHTPGSDPVDRSPPEPPRVRLAETRRLRSLGREGTCRSPT